MYLQTKSRSGRWESIKPSPAQRGSISNVGSRTSAYSHYLVRAAESDEDTKWLQRTHEYTLDKYGFETSGASPNWFYEWNGWGTLTKTLETWMAGDPVSYVDGERQSGIHVMPGTVNAADYDYYNISEDGEGHTYHKVTAVGATAYRPDGGVALKEIDGRWVVANTEAGEWLNYTVACPLADTYDVYVTYKAISSPLLGAAVAGGEKVTAELPASTELKEALIGTLKFPAGASVVRLYVENPGEGLEIASIRVEYNSEFESTTEIFGDFDAKNKKFNAKWSFYGMLPTDINLWRCPVDDESKAEIISASNTLGEYEDKALDGTVPFYTYWVSYKHNGVEAMTDKVGFEWGELDDSFENEEMSEWSIPGSNGTGEYSDGYFKVTPNSSGASRIGRSWSFPFHGGNFPILAFKMERPAGMTMSLYSGSNSWNNGYDTFDGKIGEKVYYYNLLDGSFQTSKGVAKTTVATDDITSLPLQLRTTGPVDSDPLVMHWVRTFRSVDALKDFVTAEESAVEEIFHENIDGQYYNLMGVPCGRDSTKLPKGIYIINGRKVMK